MSQTEKYYSGRSLLLPAQEDAAPESAVLHRCLKSLPHIVESAYGSYLTLDSDESILDACCGAVVACIGHGNTEVRDAAFAQWDKLAYAHTMQYRTKAAEDLGRCILEPHPSSPNFDPGLRKAFFVCSGSEANDSGMKCGKQYFHEKGESQRRFFISRRQAYHGGTIGAMSISSMQARKVPYDGIFMPNVVFVGAADAFHSKGKYESEADFVIRLVKEVEDVIEKVGAENIISFIGETVSGAALGGMPAPYGYWLAIRALCDRYGILLHLDEVMCGMGRTGTYFAFEQEGIKPDIATVGKGLGGGYQPISAMLVNEKILNVLRQGTSSFNHGHTFQAHPVGCATALKVQQIIKRERLVERCAEQGAKLEKMLHDVFGDAEFVADIRGRGLLKCLEFMLDPMTKTPFPQETAFGTKFQLATFDSGVAIYPGAGTVDGFVGDHVLVAPPYTVSDEELAITVSTMKKAYDRTAAELFRAKI